MARGSVRRHDGGWGYRIHLGADPSTGRRRQASKQGFRTKREAELAMQAVVHLDAAHRGLGTASCGPDVLPQYRIPAREFRFAYRLSVVKA